MIPIYCPLKKNFTFDSEILKQEIDLLIKPFSQERTLPFKNGRSIYDSEGVLNIAPDEILNDTSRYSLDENNNRIYISGTFKTYHVFNLTYLEEEPDSKIDIYNSTDPKKHIFWHKYKKPFVWREELENTYIKQVVEQFPWEYIQGVRVIHMDPPSIGQVHRDSHTFANKKYFDEGHASISLNIDPGGGVMKFLDNANQEFEVDNNVKVYHFDDSAAHGVTPITTSRYQIRIWGKLSAQYESLMDLERAIYK